VGLGHWEIIVIVLAILLLFGGRKIPELMKGLGTGMREFKRGLRGDEEEPRRPNDTPQKLEPPKNP
jgi:sec-independent protein translocase protein TatA